jgi:biotin carboxyl carrier protein
VATETLNAMHRYTIVVDGKSFTLDVRELGAEEFRVRVGSRELEVRLDNDQELAEGTITPAILSNDVRAESGVIVREVHAPSQASSAATKLNAPMPGVIVQIGTERGAVVQRGDVLLTLEAMKMRNDIRAPRDGVVEEVLVTEGQSVAFGELLVRFREPQ